MEIFVLHLSGRNSSCQYPIQNLARIMGGLVKGSPDPVKCDCDFLEVIQRDTRDTDLKRDKTGYQGTRLTVTNSRDPSCPPAREGAGRGQQWLGFFWAEGVRQGDVPTPLCFLISVINVLALIKSVN